MVLTARMGPSGFPEEGGALLLSGDAAGLRELRDRLAGRVDGALPLARGGGSGAAVQVRLGFCDQAGDERCARVGAGVVVTLSPASADQAWARVAELLGEPGRAFRYIDLRAPRRAAFSVVVLNY